MTRANFLNTWQGLTLETRLSRVFIALLLVSNLLLIITLGHVDRTVVMVPPVLNQSVTQARASASQEVAEAWALYVAELLGNVAPSNATFLRQALEPLLAATLRGEALRVLDGQVAEIRREQVNIAFQPREISRDPATGAIFITGTHVTSGPAAKPVTTTRTYVVQVEFKNYRPVITRLESYPGEPRTSDTKGGS